MKKLRSIEAENAKLKAALGEPAGQRGRVTGQRGPAGKDVGHRPGSLACIHRSAVRAAAGVWPAISGSSTTPFEVGPRLPRRSAARTWKTRVSPGVYGPSFAS